MFYAGIDWADQKHDGLVLDEAGRKLGSIRVPHTPEGLDQLDAWLSSMLGGQDKDQMACILETNHGLLIAALLDAGFPVYPVNPKTVDRHRKPVFRQNGCDRCLFVGKNGTQRSAGSAPAPTRYSSGARTQNADA